MNSLILSSGVLSTHFLIFVSAIAFDFSLKCIACLYATSSIGKCLNNNSALCFWFSVQFASFLLQCTYFLLIVVLVYLHFQKLRIHIEPLFCFESLIASVSLSNSSHLCFTRRCCRASIISLTTWNLSVTNYALGIQCFTEVSIFLAVSNVIPYKNIIYTNFDNWFFCVISGIYHISYYFTCENFGC